MGKVVQLKNKGSNEKIYPKTYTGAVIDDKGSNLDTLLSDQNDRLDELEDTVVISSEDFISAESMDNTIINEALRKTPQSLTIEEQYQSRKNIDAASKSDVDKKLNEIETKLGISNGTAISGFIYLKSESNLPDNPENKTIGYIIGTSLYIFVQSGGDIKSGKYKKISEFRGPKGEKGDTGNAGESLKWKDLTDEQVTALRGPKGERGDKGDKGDKGDNLKFSDLTFDEKMEIRGPEGPIGKTGATGPKGDPGNSGYHGAAGELELVNNLTQGGTRSALTAEQGKILKVELNRLNEEFKKAISILNNYGISFNDVIKNLNLKVDKIPGKQLSTNDFTTAEKSKLSGLKNYDDTTIKNDIKNIKNEIDSIKAKLNNK